MASLLILPPFCRPLSVLAALRLCVDVSSTCISRWLERFTGSCRSGCRLRVWIEAGRNSADGTTERACYFAAVCTQKWKSRLTPRREDAKKSGGWGRGGWMKSHGCVEGVDYPSGLRLGATRRTARRSVPATLLQCTRKRKSRLTQRRQGAKKTGDWGRGGWMKSHG